MTSGNKAVDRLQVEMPEVMDAYINLHGEVVKDGAVSVKHKRLMLVAIAVNIRCELCLRTHIHGAIVAGATRDEIREAAEVGMLMSGGPGVAFCTAYFIDTLNELEAKAAKRASFA